jgi:hypothetical protein
MEARKRTEQEHGNLPPEYKTPVAKLFEKAYSEWTKKDREWLDAVYKRLFPSPRGRKAENEYDKLFDERETAKVKSEYPGIFGESEMVHENKIPSYTELASRAFGIPVSAKLEDDLLRQRLIRAYQRRKKAQSLPDPPQD